MTEHAIDSAVSCLIFCSLYSITHQYTRQSFTDEGRNPNNVLVNNESIIQSTAAQTALYFAAHRTSLSIVSCIMLLYFCLLGKAIPFRSTPDRGLWHCPLEVYQLHEPAKCENMSNLIKPMHRGKWRGDVIWHERRAWGSPGQQNANWVEIPTTPENQLKRPIMNIQFFLHHCMQWDCSKSESYRKNLNHFCPCSSTATHQSKSPLDWTGSLWFSYRRRRPTILQLPTNLRYHNEVRRKGRI